MSKNGRQTIGNELMEQLDDSPISLLTTPTQKTEKRPIEKQNIQENDNVHESKHLLSAKERITVQISKDTIERVKDCVYWNRLTVAQFVEEALEAALVLAEKGNGKPFEKRRSALKPGRPIK